MIISIPKNKASRKVKYDECTEYCINKLIKKGANKASCFLQIKKKNELYSANNIMTLNRTTINIELTLNAIVDNKQATFTINKVDKAYLDDAINEVIALAKSSYKDISYDIAEFQSPECFEEGEKEADIGKMYELLSNYLNYTSKTYTNIIIEEASLEFNKSYNYFKNSNHVDFFFEKGHYNFFTSFFSKKRNKISSRNYSGFTTDRLNKEIKEYSNIDVLLKQSSEQIETNIIKEKFVGDIIISPDCLIYFIHYLTEYIKDNALIANTSIYKDKLNKKVADYRFTLHSSPFSKKIKNGYAITSDGYKAKNCTIIQKGILKTFLLSQYGSKKTGFNRVDNYGETFIIENGDLPYDEIVKNIKKGILLCRFSGGYPSRNGDFSGIAKNSYFIEDGKIKYPISETMISSNLKNMFLNIKDISKETINYGDGIYPWISFKDITISVK